MSKEQTREVALKAYELLKNFEFVTFQVFNDEDDTGLNGSGFVEIDNVCFHFDSQGRIEKTEVDL
jgi:hypothetical protein